MEPLRAAKADERTTPGKPPLRCDIMGQRPVPPRGMRDLLPKEVLTRRHLLEPILGVYERYGYQQIETPALEDINVLGSSDGGDNEKLLYKVLKRGLEFPLPVNSESQLVDLGLRYDLTVPLARFYASHQPELLHPFRSIQAGNVWRAERPQKGRYRQFTQCDIDILGDPTVGAEIELSVATAEALAAVDVGSFTIRVNDRRLSGSLLKTAGFTTEQYGPVLIALDKMDKIGIEGVRKELERMGNSEASSMISTTLERLSEAHGIDATLDALPGPVDDNAISDLSAIVEGVGAALPWVETAIDATLVRGMGYYTGAIFEIRHNELTGSLAGGGRYDKMIGKLSGTDVPAVGFSIGFERLYDLLEGRGRSVDAQRQRRIAMLYDSEASAAEVMAAAQHLRSQGDIVRTEPSVKNRGGQLKRLAEAGFTQWGEFRTDGEVVVQSLSEEAPSSSGDRL